MILRKGYKSFLKTVSVSLLAGLIFVGAGYSYLSFSGDKKPADNEVSSVPYYSSVPENTGVMLELCNRKTFFFLDFENTELAVIYADAAVIKNSSIYGYRIDYTVKAESKVLENIIDAVGGIDLDAENEILNYTGVQITELLDANKDNSELHRRITQNLIDRIGEYGLSNNELLYIIKNSETDLTVPDCYFWAEHIGNLCKSVRYIN